MNNVDKQYLDLLKYILDNGIKKSDRTGTGTISVFDYTMKFDMKEGFPLITSKKMFTKGIIHELIWFLRGDTNIKYLLDNDVHIWDGDAYKKYLHRFNGRHYPDNSNLSKEEFIEKIKTDTDFAKIWGELGPVYGSQWRKWEGHVQKSESYHNYFDQIAILIKDLKSNPDSRRLMVSAWNVADIDKMTLPPCHYGFQCYTSELNIYERKKIWCDSIGKSIHYAEDFGDDELDTFNVPRRRLSLKWTQRSVDSFLGLPFNIASYGILLHLLAREANMIPHELIFSGGDVHLYTNHIDQVKEQLQRETFDLPKLVLKNKSIDELKYEDIEIINYKSDKVIKAELSN